MSRFPTWHTRQAGWIRRAESGESVPEAARRTQHRSSRAMQQYFRGQISNTDLLARLLETADRSGLCRRRDLRTRNLRPGRGDLPRGGRSLRWAVAWVASAHRFRVPAFGTTRSSIRSQIARSPRSTPLGQPSGTTPGVRERGNRCPRCCTGFVTSNDRFGPPSGCLSDGPDPADPRDARRAAGCGSDLVPCQFRRARRRAGQSPGARRSQPGGDHAGHEPERDGAHHGRVAGQQPASGATLAWREPDAAISACASAGSSERETLLGSSLSATSWRTRCSRASKRRWRIGGAAAP